MPFLAQPNCSKSTRVESGNGLTAASCAMQGWRDAMEDAELMCFNLPGREDIAAFGVFDGHGGDAVSKVVSRSILQHLQNDQSFTSGTDLPGLVPAVCKAFLSVDAELRTIPKVANVADEVGSTGLLVLVSKEHILCANIGDSRCIIASKGEVTELSIDHKPTDEKEAERIVAAGGSIFRGRVCGGVAVSRSFGDFWFKRNGDLQPNEQQVTCEPHIRIQQRRGEDEFLVLACDGIWDVMTNETAYKFVKDRVQSKKNLGVVCEHLLDDCLGRGSRDNMTAIIVMLTPMRRNSGHKCMLQ